MPVMYVTPGGIAVPSATDGVAIPLLSGKAGEAIIAEGRGRYWNAAYRGRAFIASQAAAGFTIPISSTTSPTFTLYNPIGSSVVVELDWINIGITNATLVVSPLLLGYITGLTVAPTSLTSRTITPALLGGSGVPLSQFYTTATLAAAATTFITIGSVSATSGAFPNFNFEIAGAIGLFPGSLVFLCGTAAQSSASTTSLGFSEWPL